MKFFASFVLILVLSLAAGLYLPWWSIAITSFAVSVAIPQKPAIAFLTGFLAIFILWGALAFYLSSNNQHILAHKISILILKKDDPYLLVGVSACIGALVAGVAALSGSWIRPKSN